LVVSTHFVLVGHRLDKNSARAIAGSLTALTSLDLSGNQIGDDGLKSVVNFLANSHQTNVPGHLDLRDNGDSSSFLPKEVLESMSGEAIVAAYRRFATAQTTRTLRPLNELKLLVVGKEAVGKTSMVRYLIEGKPRDPSEARTLGIGLHEKIRIQEWSPTDCQVQLNVWDFGGQEMLRGTHRFFLTERSLYLLVLEDRLLDDRSIYEWMKVIRNRGGDSPVIVVINKSDEGKQDLRPDQGTLQKEYSNIVRFLRTSCNPGTWAADSIQALRAAIVACITKDQRLRHGTDPIPDGWLAIKHQVTTLAEQRSVLGHADFRRLCEYPGSDVEPVTNEYEQRALLELLHQLGTIIAHGLERGASAARREVSLLNPNWLTAAVYRILEQARAADQQGEFLSSQLSDWLDPGAYPADRHEFILDMMQDPEIGLCFRVPGAREERYLVPEALSENRPYVGKLIEDAPVFRFRYNYLPSGLIPRLIVQSHHYLPPDMPRWRSGVMLKTSQCQVLVLADLEPPGKLDLRVEGPTALRRAALNVVLNDLEAVHALNPEAQPDPRVPIPGQPDKDVGYQYLLELEGRYDADRSLPFEGASREYTVRELLEGVRRDHVAPQNRYVAERSTEQPAAPHVVVLIHGIRTAALWQSSVRRSLEREGFRVQLTNYGIF
jgi:internalin A